MIDIQYIFNGLCAIVVAVIGWFVRGLREENAAQAAALTLLNRDITELRVKLAEEYITHADMRDIKDTLIRIESKLDGKQDKVR